MKIRITPEQLLELSDTGRQRLSHWWDSTHEDDDRDTFLVFIPEEVNGEFRGVFEKAWDDDCEFIYPDEYIGKLNRHQGTVLPLMDVTLLWQFLEDHNLAHPQQTVDELWMAVAYVLEERSASND